MASDWDSYTTSYCSDSAVFVFCPLLALFRLLTGCLVWKQAEFDHFLRTISEGVATTVITTPQIGSLQI